jgi:transposase
MQPTGCDARDRIAIRHRPSSAFEESSNAKSVSHRPKEIADALGVTQGVVSQSIARGKAGGQQALRNRKSPGAPRRLSTEQRARLPALLARGAQAFGFVGDVWTGSRIAAVIKREFGVAYHPDHIGRVVAEIGWTLLKPIERATQRDEAALTQWRDEHWPPLKKGRG